MDIVRKIGVIFGLVCLTFFTSSSFAFTQTPESGWWWNPDENGRGYNIEVQDHFIFLSAYVYDDVKTDGVVAPFGLPLAAH